MNNLTIPLDEQNRLLQQLDTRTDAEAARIKRYLNMADLSRKDSGPIRELVNNIVGLEQFNDFDIITIPEIVPADASFDLFNFPPDHPARSHSDTLSSIYSQPLSFWPLQLSFQRFHQLGPTHVGI